MNITSSRYNLENYFYDTFHKKITIKNFLSNRRENATIYAKVLTKRRYGAITFVDVKDYYGTIHCILCQEFKGIQMNIGDVLLFSGSFSFSNPGTPSMLVFSVRFLFKSFLHRKNIMRQRINKNASVSVYERY